MRYGCIDELTCKNYSLYFCDQCVRCIYNHDGYDLYEDLDEDLDLDGDGDPDAE